MKHGNVNAKTFINNSTWKTLNAGVCEGKLIGGYIENFALLLGNDYFHYDKETKYVLFLEEYEQFSSIAKVSSYLSHIEQHHFIRNVVGLVFGHYSSKEYLELLQRLQRFGKKHDVPVVYCDDFGHGNNHAIIPIGSYGKLDAERQSMTYIN